MLLQPVIYDPSFIRTANTSPKSADAAAATAAIITVSRFCRTDHWNSQHKTHPRRYCSSHCNSCHRSHRSIHDSCCYRKPLLMDQPLEQPPHQLAWQIQLQPSQQILQDPLQQLSRKPVLNELQHSLAVFTIVPTA
jgi:hypothetical protein